MSVFTSSLLDDFNRANGALGANWTTLNSQNAPGINTNKIAFGGSPGAPFAACYNALGPLTDCEVFSTDGGHASNGGGLRLIARATSPTTSSAKWYFCSWSGSPSNGGLIVGRDGPGTTTISIAGSQAARITSGAGDKIGFRVYDQTYGSYTVTVLEGWVMLAAEATWRCFVAASDSDQTQRISSGYLGAGGFASFTGERTSQDDFSGGSISGASILDRYYDHAVEGHFFRDGLSEIASDGHCGLGDRGKASKDWMSELGYSRWPLPLVPGSPFRGMGGGVHVL